MNRRPSELPPPVVEPQPPVVVLSPHLDDAVLSCFAVLSRQGTATTVVTVFAGVPGPGTVGRWDASQGVSRSDEYLAERAADDLDVMAGLGVRAVHLPLLDEQYRTSRLTTRSLARRLEQHVEGADVHAPAGFGQHPDHVLVRDAALRAFTGMASLRLYADLPYAADQGWPLECRDGSCGRDLPETLPGIASRPRVTGCEHEALTAETASAKLRCLARYRSQFPLLDGPSGELRRRAVDRFEARWTVGEDVGR
ncbi:MAG TPA: PIG-L family deacetylase [Jatrophihabitans sp.]